LPLAALVAVTEQVPLPLVIDTMFPETVQLPMAPKVTDPSPLPPLLPTVNVVP
jgi:hypothetical protein